MNTDETWCGSKIYRGNPKYERLYDHAIMGLNSLYIRGEGGYTGNTRVPFTTKHLLAIAFFWDTSFSSVGAREFDPLLLGQEAIENFVNNHTPRGSLPGTLSDTHRAGEGQAPIMCWSAWRTYQSAHDKAWLARVYPGLAGYVNFRVKYYSSSRGLVQFFNAGQISDNDARFDRVYNRDNGGEHGNEPVSGFESPDLNAFLNLEMRSLALMATELNLPCEAPEWKGKANKLAKLIVDCCYFPDEAMFYDVVEGTHEKFSDHQKIGKDGYELSQPEYNWTESAAIELLLERYKRGRSPTVNLAPHSWPSLICGLEIIFE